MYQKASAAQQAQAQAVTEQRQAEYEQLAAGLPFLPLVFMVVPAQEVLRTVAELLK